MQFKSFMEALKGNQHKIDKNKNGKIDAQDFKLLQKEEDKDSPSAKSHKHIIFSKLTDKDVADYKKMKEEVEDLDERNKENAMMRKTMDASRGARFKAKGNYTPDPEPEHKTAQAHNKAIGRAIRKMSNEQLELEESHFKIGDMVKCKSSGMKGEVVKMDKDHGEDDDKYYTVKKQDGKTMKFAPNELSLVKEARDLPFTPDPVKKPVKNSDGTVQSPMSRARELAQQGMKKVMKQKMKEEFDIDMSDEQVDYIIECMNEEIQELDEISKKTLGSYVNKASVDMANRTADGERKRTLAGADYAQNIKRGMSAKTADADMKKDQDAAKPDVKKSVKRMYGISKAVGRLTKEEIELDEQTNVKEDLLSYKEFMMMLEYEGKGGVYRHTGTYGSEYAKKEREKDEKGFDSDDKQSAEKRGRGRPAGAKSGARKITGTSKLYK